MADKIKVYDPEGHERLVHPVDAREIVAHGGSLVLGQVDAKGKPRVLPDIQRKLPVTHPAETKAPVEAPAEVVEEKPKGKPGRKPKS